MRPQRFSCGITSHLGAHPSATQQFNEAAAFQLRNHIVSPEVSSANPAFNEAAAFQLRNHSPRASLRAAWAFGKGCETCRKPRRHMGTECSHAGVNKTQIPDCERTIVVRALPGKCAITGALAPGGEIRRSRAHARPARNPCLSLPPEGRRGRRVRRRRRECDLVHGE